MTEKSKQIEYWIAQNPDGSREVVMVGTSGNVYTCGQDDYWTSIESSGLIPIRKINLGGKNARTKDRS